MPTFIRDHFYTFDLEIDWNTCSLLRNKRNVLSIFTVGVSCKLYISLYRRNGPSSIVTRISKTLVCCCHCRSPADTLINSVSFHFSCFSPLFFISSIKKNLFHTKKQNLSVRKKCSDKKIVVRKIVCWDVYCKESSKLQLWDPLGAFWPWSQKKSINVKDWRLCLKKKRTKYLIELGCFDVACREWRP